MTGFIISSDEAANLVFVLEHGVRCYIIVQGVSAYTIETLAKAAPNGIPLLNSIRITQNH